MKKILLIISILVLTALSSAKSQFIEDALRYTQSNGFVTARAGGLSTAFHGVSDDISALMFNPAGISLIGRSELSLGLGFSRNSTETQYLSTLNNFNSNSAYITHAGVVMPFNTKQGNAGMAIAYFLDNDFNNNAEYGAFNPNNSMIKHQTSITNNPSNSIPYNMALAGLMNGVMYTELQDSLYQTVFVQEKGGLHNVVGGASFELSKFVTAGFTIQGKWGTYRYVRDFTEMDLDNLYNADRVVQFDNNKELVFDLYKFTYSEDLTQKVIGVTGSLGVMGRIDNFMRFGVTVKFPTFYEIEEDFSEDAIANFDNGEYTQAETKKTNSYKLTTPFVFSAGFSIFAGGMTFSGGVEYTDVTQIEFSDALKDIEALNKDIVRDLVGQVKWGVGVEYEIPLTPIVVRGSYGSTTSPYTKDIGGAAVYYVTLGGGIYLAPNIRLDGLFRWLDYSELRNNYGGTTYILGTNPLNIAAGLTYRY